MATSWKIRRTVDLEEWERKAEYLGILAFTGAKNAHQLILTVLENDKPFIFTDETNIMVYFLRAGEKVMIRGSVMANVVTVRFPAAAYAIQSRVSVLVCAENDDEIVPLYAAVFDPGKGSEDVIIDPEDIIALPELLKHIETTKEATAAANQAASDANAGEKARNEAEKSRVQAEQTRQTEHKNAIKASEDQTARAKAAADMIDGMTVSAEKAEEAAASINEVNGVKHITFSLPKGDKGDTGGYYMPSLSGDGTLRWYPSQSGMQILGVGNIKGPKGDKGDKGDTGSPMEIAGGNTINTTPTEVADCLGAGYNIAFSHVEPGFDELIFRSFANLMDKGLLVSSCVVEHNGEMVICHLVGDMREDTWEFSVIPLTSESSGGSTSSSEPWLIGATEQITPTEVVEALAAQRNVMISHPSNPVGLVVFTSFTMANGLNAIASSCIVNYYGQHVAVQLVGFCETNEWSFEIIPILQNDDITTENITAALGYTPANAETVSQLSSEKLDASALPTAVNDALAQAKESGEFDGVDGVGINSVVQTTTSSADGGSNVVTVTKTDGTTSTFTVKNGSKGSQGDPGKTPVKGTDYWTAADRQQMVNDVIAALPVYNGEVV
ncbi:MAG: hypothetical protein IKK34_04775 [Clostridia bacterium]|nr:hypothetical protein [Clostridia bacterium]